MITMVRRSVDLEREDIERIKELAQCKGLGARGFSAALRMIIREWVELKNGNNLFEQHNEMERVQNV